MVKVGLFHTGGYTEIGALQQFLEKCFPEILFERCFPARIRNTPLRRARGPGEGSERETKSPFKDGGVTGADLVDRMVAIIAEHHRNGKRPDVYLFVDDADCRFCESEEEKLKKAGKRKRITLESWRKDVSDRVSEALQEDIPVFCWLAFQEIEAWLLADWSNTFGKEYPKDEVRLQKDILSRLGLDGWAKVEGYGCSLKTGGGCTYKLSSEVQEAVMGYAESSNRPVFYSKAIHGNAMLRRLDAPRVSTHCRQFKTDFLHFQTVLSHLTGDA